MNTTSTLQHTVCPGLTSEGSTMTAQPDSNAAGSRPSKTAQSEPCAAGHGQCRTVKDRLGSRGLEQPSRVVDDLWWGTLGYTSLECGRNARKRQQASPLTKRPSDSSRLVEGRHELQAEIDTPPHTRGHTPAGGGRNRTCGHRFGSEGSRTAATEDPQLPNDRRHLTHALVT